MKFTTVTGRRHTITSSERPETCYPISDVIRFVGVDNFQLVGFIHFAPFAGWFQVFRIRFVATDQIHNLAIEQTIFGAFGGVDTQVSGEVVSIPFIPASRNLGGLDGDIAVGKKVVELESARLERL